MSFQPNNVLVTGGAGFIGSHFIHTLLRAEPSVQVINLDKLTYAGSLENLNDLSDPERHIFIQGDILDKTLLDQLLHQYQIDSIIHFAAESHVDRSISAPDAFIQTNVVGTYTLCEAAKNYWQQTNQSMDSFRFYHISTDEVYGSLKKTDPLFTETTAYQPRSPYSASKAGSDHIVHAYGHTYQLPILMSHCSNNYGPHQHDEKLIPTIIRNCLNQTPIPVYGNGMNIRDWLYVTDHCDGILTILRQGTLGECYNLGGNNEWQNIDLVRTICQRMDVLFPERAPHERLIEFVTDRAGHDFRYAIDTSKVKNQLNWQPQETIESGLDKTIAFYLTQFN